MAKNINEPNDRADLDLLQRGFQVSRILSVVADIGLADVVPVQGHATVAELAAACHVLPEPLLRMIRALAAFGVFRLAPDEMVEHTPRSRLMRTDARNSMRHGARFWTSPGAWSAWGQLEAALRGRVPKPSPGIQIASATFGNIPTRCRGSTR